MAFHLFPCDRIFPRFYGILFAALLLGTPAALAGGPKYVAGTSYFNPAAAGQPLRWANGVVNYYIDQGPLNSTVTNQQATTMVDAAAALWSAVPTAGVTLVDRGALNEDVSGANIVVASNVVTAPADVTPSATNYPVAVVYDADGAVIDAVFGAGTSDPTSCNRNGVLVWADNRNPDATFAHAVIVLNGRCATTPDLLQMMSFELERAFGTVLGLGYSQVNLAALQNGELGGTQGMPVMQPASGACGPSGGECIPDPSVLRYDDVAALNRLYPITAANLASFSGKQITATNTIAIRGTVSFRDGYGMQGVNVVARPLDANGNPLYQYTVTAVSGALFSGKHGNPVTGWKDADGTLLSQWGSEDATLQGEFDLSGVPLPPGVTSADYQISFEALDPFEILNNSVGPYTDGQVTPSGTLQPLVLHDITIGSARTLTITAADSADGGSNDAIGSEQQPRVLPATGMWRGRLSQVGQTDWFTFPVRGGRMFTVVTQAVDETGAPSDGKAMPSIGVWDAFDAPGVPAAGAAPGLNGIAEGETWLRVSASYDDTVRIGVADRRGDGRPDYVYNGWVLYADTVEPARLTAAGGSITIRGVGFRTGDTVLVGGQPALVTSISPTEITAVAPPPAAGVTGSVDVEVDDEPNYYAAAIIAGGVSYDAASGDSLSLVTAPANTVFIGVPLPFAVTALGSDLAPAGGVTVTYTVTSGTATLGCGLPACSVISTGDGRASINVTAVDSTASVVAVSLANGASLQAHFTGGTPPTLAALTPQLSLAAGATFTWTVQVLALQSGLPAAGQMVKWQPANGIAVQGTGIATTNAKGIATQVLTVGPLTEGQQASIQACLNGTGQCVSFTAFGARPAYARLQAVSGVRQSLSLSGTPAQIVLRLLDMNGNPMAGGTVELYQTLYAWTPPCSPHAVCAPGALLSTQSGAATSGTDGTVIFAPAAIPGVPTQLIGLAVAGNSATVGIAVEKQ